MRAPRLLRIIGVVATRPPERPSASSSHLPPGLGGELRRCLPLTPSAAGGEGLKGSTGFCRSSACLEAGVGVVHLLFRLSSALPASNGGPLVRLEVLLHLEEVSDPVEQEGGEGGEAVDVGPAFGPGHAT